MHCLLLSVEIHAVFGHCLNDQQSLMVQLKNTIKLDNNSNWDENSDCCVWEGVTCHKGLVTGLSLRGKTAWVISNLSAICDLKYLESLDLSHTMVFYSLIPSRIGELKNLRYLNLAEAGFVGQVPKEIALLTRLVSLDLSSRSFWPTPQLVNPNLSFLIQNLTQLEELYLDGVNVSLTGKELSKALSSSLPNLRELSMIACSIAGPIDMSLLKLKSLSVIHLDFNHFYSPFPRFMSEFSRLRSLSCLSCGFSGIFPEEIFQVPTLHALDMSQNELLEGSLPNFLPNNSIESIVISDTKFSGRLPISIGNLRNLSRLELANCEFNGTLPNSMAELTQLVYVDLSSNKFTGSIPSFSMSKNLTKINLSHNDLSGATTSAHWEGLLYLVDVDLSYNSLNGSIPPSLFSLPSLQNIQLSCNKFNGLVPEFPNAPSMILDTLNLSHNNLEGPIPGSIFELGKLTNLLLSFNKLNGTIQGHTFRRLEELVHLDLSYNNLSFNISGNDSLVPYLPKLETLKLASCNLSAFPDVKNHSSLTFLDLSINQISGVIPNWTWELGNGSLNYLNLSFNQLVGIQEPYIFPPLLGVLDLHFNMLHGKLPIPPTPIYVDLSNNYFSSSIRADIGKNLSNAVLLSLSNNSLTGFIPESICQGVALEVLDLSNNGLSGRVPDCIPQMSQKLYILNLQKNNLSGPIPNAFPVNCSLKTLHLNGNSIQGQVPESISKCTKLQILDLGNNQIIDGFPSFFMSISTLRVLVLRSNRFHGCIKCLNTSSSNTWTTLQLFDAAYNNFSGELSSCLSRGIGKARTYQANEAQSQLQNELIFQYTGGLAFMMSMFEDDLLFY
ncbi:receptor-like protein 6 [Ziziphus jujuba]|uniref:Receptor-like protein 6 n=1 Tax=Ziziphus jujuba TaxID=326968 RepID=A0A6P4AIB2_ZIZJJ|nr:receptor-like protein 6 [Ziziphus jujuba]